MLNQQFLAAHPNVVATADGVFYFSNQRTAIRTAHFSRHYELRPDNGGPSWKIKHFPRVPVRSASVRLDNGTELADSQIDLMAEELQIA